MALLTVKEVAAATRHSQRTVRNWIKAGRLPAQRVGRKHLIREEDLERFGIRLPRSPDRPIYGTHIGALFTLAKLIRDRLNVPAPASIVTGPGFKPEGPWDSTQDSIELEGIQAQEEEQVEVEWTTIGGYVGNHQLLPRLREHLDGHECWAVMSRIDRIYVRYASLVTVPAQQRRRDRD